jgi:hypothetical protein
MTAINRSQFKGMASKLNEPGGGFSVHLKTGEEPTSGIMVSQAGTEKRFKAGEHVGGKEVAAHGIEHQSEFEKPHNFQGGWHDSITGDRTLDVSRQYKDRGSATKAMWANDQDGAYDLDRSDDAKGEDGHTINNFAKRGTAGTTLGKYLHEEPMNPAQYGGLRRAAARG